LQVISYVFSALAGLVVGSFLNVVIFRLPVGESLVRPPSHCPECEAPIRWYDNVPLASWTWLRGRCRRCGGRISVRYPLVEALTALSFTLAYWRFGLTWDVGIAWIFVALIIVVALIDYDHMIIPNRITIPGSLVCLAASISLHPRDWWVYLAAAGGAALFCFLLAVVFQGMGGGDVTMALLVGSALGRRTVVAFFLAFLTGSLAGLYLVAVKKRSRKAKVPFGPFLAVGSYVALFAGDVILDSYLGLWN
jgi:leader peptidase (prepilin peptidase)/N-methyltransferase